MAVTDKGGTGGGGDAIGVRARGGVAIGMDGDEPGCRQGPACDEKDGDGAMAAEAERAGAIDRGAAEGG